MFGIKLAKFIENFNKSQKEILGDCFTISEFEKAVNEKKILIEDVKSFIMDEDLGLFEWTNELKDTIAAIRSIARNPRTTLQSHPEVLNSEKVPNISNKVINETMNHTEYWKFDDNGNIRPEKLIAPIFDDEINIYENRFIIFLINKLDPFLKNALSYLLARVNFMEDKFVKGQVDFTEYMNLDDLVSLEKELSDKTLLTNVPYLQCVASITQTINVIRYVKNSSFYKILRKIKPMKDEDVRVTNILASHPQYGRCYRFYVKLKRFNRDFFEKPGIDFTPSYKDYVFCNMMLSLKELGYRFFDDVIFMKDGHIIIDNEKPIIGRHKSGAKIFLSCDIDKIYARISMKFDNEVLVPSTLRYRRTSWLEFDCIANTQDEYEVRQLQEKCKYIIGDKVGKTCTNVFMVTPFISNLKYSFLLCSPASFDNNADLKNALKSSTTFIDVDTKIYKHICPICGKHIVVEDNIANYSCPHCYSTYSYCKRGKDWENNDTVWVKRIGRPGRA